MSRHTHRRVIGTLCTAALVPTLLSTTVLVAAPLPATEQTLNRLQVGLGIGGQFSTIDLNDVSTEYDDASDDGAGLNFALSLGYRLNERTTLGSAVHYVHQHHDSDAMRGIGMLGVGVRHRFGHGAPGWYVDGLIGGAFVTQAFEDADDLDDDDFATGKGCVWPSADQLASSSDWKAHCSRSRPMAVRCPQERTLKQRPLSCS